MKIKHIKYLIIPIVVLGFIIFVIIGLKKRANELEKNRIPSTNPILFCCGVRHSFAACKKRNIPSNRCTP